MNKWPAESGDIPTENSTVTSGRMVVAVEFLLIFVLFFVAAGQRAPHVNESHYLTRSVHFWNPQWCSGDLFLESQEAHPVFHWTIGWISQFVSLPTYAWISRVVGWFVLAAGWVFLSNRVLRSQSSVGPVRSSRTGRFGWALFSVAVAVALWSRAHLAGEWVVGGCEAKVPAYALVFFGLGQLATGHYRFALPFFGLAASFHPLVGGWALVAIFIAWLCDTERPTMERLVLPAAGALCLAAPGVIAALRLDAGVDPEVVKQAHRIYVFKRLGHHLLLAKFATINIVRHLVLIAAWLGLWRFLAKRNLVDRRLQRVNRFVLGCVLLAATGAVIELITHRNPYICSDWMRYYWYRMTDSMVPVGFAFCLVTWITRSSERETEAEKLPTGNRGWAFVISLVLIAVSTFSTFAKHTKDRRAPGDMQGRTRNRSIEDVRQDDVDWKAICAWCRENTPEDAMFLTPSYNQTFKWYAHRAEFSTWKDTPQDSNSIVQWNERRRRLLSMGFDRLRPKPTGKELGEYFREANIQWVIVARHYGEAHWHLQQPQEFRLVKQNESYQLFEFVK